MRGGKTPPRDNAPATTAVLTHLVHAIEAVPESQIELSEIVASAGRCADSLLKIHQSPCGDGPHNENPEQLARLYQLTCDAVTNSDYEEREGHQISVAKSLSPRSAGGSRAGRPTHSPPGERWRRKDLSHA